MGVEIESKNNINGVCVPCVIPATKQIVYFLKGSDINFDKFNLRGNGILLQNAMKALAGEEYSVVEINLNDFFQTSDNQAKINYLISQGIESNVAEGDYNFSEIKDDSKSDSGSQDGILSFDIESDVEDGEWPYMSGN